MGWFEAIFLGLVQGLTEFLPISSSAHLLITGQLFFAGRDPGAAFTAVTQLGTETAVLIFFWRDIVRIIKNWALAIAGKIPRDDPDARMGWLVIIGSLPIGILGILFENAIDTHLRNLWITVAMLAGVGLVLLFADRHAMRRGDKQLKDLNWIDGIIFGLAQAAALIPGVSRSGGTISAGLFMGYSREAAARYSFLLAIPAVFASGLFKLKDIGDDACASWAPTIVATLIAGVVGYLVIGWLLRFISQNSFFGFVVYRIGLAALIAALLLTGAVSPDAALTSGCGP